MLDREEILSRLGWLKPKQPVIVLVSLVLAIFVWWWVNTKELPQKPVKSNEATCECSDE